MQIHYSGRPRTTLAQERLDKAYQRLARLQGMPHSLKIKEHMLQASVLPVALHGTEVRPLAKHTLHQLRSKVADAALGPCHSASPSIALACTISAILDPEFVMIKRICQSAKRFLTNATDWEQLCFLKIATQFGGNIDQVTGPASAFAFVLMQLNWTVDLVGTIQVTAFLKIDIVASSRKRLNRLLEQAWLDGLIMRTTQRTKHFWPGNISRRDTVATLKQFPEERHAALIKHIAFAAQHSDQRHHWATQEESVCILCGAEDSREHRLFYCPVGQQQREPFDWPVKRHEQHGSCQAEFSVITQHPYAEAYQALHFGQPEAIIAEAALSMVGQRRIHQTPVHWFTDGSVAYPKHPTSAFGAYAIILDLAASDDQRIATAMQYKGVLQDVDTLQCVGMARINTLT